jgi:NADPH-dependent curcumin reductase CurA
MTQYYDMLTDVGKNSRTNTIMLPHTPGAVGELREQIISAIETGKVVGTTEDRKV